MQSVEITAILTSLNHALTNRDPGDGEIGPNFSPDGYKPSKMEVH